MQAIRDRIHRITALRHHLPEPIAGIVEDVNRVLRGWSAYFQVGNATQQFALVDTYVRERLDRLA